MQVLAPDTAPSRTPSQQESGYPEASATSSPSQFASRKQGAACTPEQTSVSFTGIQSTQLSYIGCFKYQKGAKGVPTP